VKKNLIAWVFQRFSRAKRRCHSSCGITTMSK